MRYTITSLHHLNVCSVVEADTEAEAEQIHFVMGAEAAEAAVSHAMHYVMGNPPFVACEAIVADEEVIAIEPTPLAETTAARQA